MATDSHCSQRMDRVSRKRALPRAANRPLLRAMLQTFPSGDRLLVGTDISDLDTFADQIKAAIISAAALLFVIAGVASILVTRRTVGRIESDQRHQPGHHAERPGSAYPAPRHP